MNYRLTIHCSATENGIPVPVATIREWHKARGFKDVGYHYVIEPSGQIEVGRDEEEKGAHVEGNNTGNVGICLVGLDKFTSAQFDSLRHLLDRFILSQQIPSWQIYGHYEFDSAKKQGKTCPNLRITDIMCWYLDDADGAIEKYLLK